MILYEYKCTLCAKITEALREIEDRNNCPPCEKCAGETKKIISKSTVHSDFTPYIDDNIGTEPTWVESKKHRKELMKKNGVTDAYS